MVNELTSLNENDPFLAWNFKYLIEKVNGSYLKVKNSMPFLTFHTHHHEPTTITKQNHKSYRERKREREENQSITFTHTIPGGTKPTIKKRTQNRGKQRKRSENLFTSVKHSLWVAI